MATVDLRAVSGAGAASPMAPRPASRSWRPRLAVSAGGAVRLASSGGFQWVLHDGPVAFLAAPLAGLSGGERVRAELRCGAGARLAVTTQGPQVLLRSSVLARQTWDVEVGPGAIAWLLPWMSIPLPGSRAQLRTDVRLDEGAAFVGWDVLAAGRVARGERFDFAHLVSEWRIAGAERELVRERADLHGRDRARLAALMADRTHVGSLYLAGFGGLLGVDEVRARLAPRRAALVGASQPDGDLVVVRMLADSADEIERCLWPVVELAAEARGEPPPRPEALARRWDALPADQTNREEIR